ncbi:gp53-like domain-containing protein [Arsenophonus nasoniae]
MVIQWGSVPRNDSSRKLFPMAFPNTLAGMGLANFNSNSNLSQMYAPNIMSADRVGFNMRQSKVTEGSNASPFTDMRWIAIGW